MTAFNILAFKSVSCAADVLRFRIMRRIYQTGINLLMMMRSLTTHVLIDVSVRNLLENIYNKAYSSILVIIMMLIDDRICFIVVPDNKYCGLLLKIQLQ